jgi:hypothetical protein
VLGPGGVDFAPHAKAYWNLVPSQNPRSFAPSDEPCERFSPLVYKLCDELEIEPLLIQWEMGSPVVVRMLDPRRRLTDPAS